ncbi:uncharacterized protein LOC134049757 [Cinclus cinclus]|uniref:uncharacterized protein LOC134049757 n=1 Tax=Cinclus cinclus TaxID=127875 RepID=UPI002E0D712E
MSDMVRLEAPPPSLRPPRGPHVTRENPALLPPTNHSARSLLDFGVRALFIPSSLPVLPVRAVLARKALPIPSGFSQDRFECSQYWFQHCAGHGHFGTPQGRARLLFSVGTDLGRAGSGGGGGRKEEREEQEGESQEHEEEELQEKEQQQNHSAPPPARSGCSSPNSGSIALPPRNPQCTSQMSSPSRAGGGTCSAVDKWPGGCPHGCFWHGASALTLAQTSPQLCPQLSPYATWTQCSPSWIPLSPRPGTVDFLFQEIQSWTGCQGMPMAPELRHLRPPSCHTGATPGATATPGPSRGDLWCPSGVTGESPAEATSPPQQEEDEKEVRM